jgi:DNA-binding NarL/FixJ family response regulator
MPTFETLFKIIPNKKMGRINVLVADGNLLMRLGLRSLVSANRDFNCADEAENSAEMFRKAGRSRPDVLIIDHTSVGFDLGDIPRMTTAFPGLKVLAITRAMPKEHINQSIASGVCSYLLKDCDQAEINEAIYATAKGEQFFCGKIVTGILNAPVDTTDICAISCDGVRISAREVEIIRLVAEGLSNKEIAEKLFLSVHTITTHRKNIMNKLGVNNTAGLVLFALKQEIISPNKYLFSSAS